MSHLDLLSNELTPEQSPAIRRDNVSLIRGQKLATNKQERGQSAFVLKAFGDYGGQEFLIFRN